MTRLSSFLFAMVFLFMHLNLWGKDLQITWHTDYEEALSLSQKEKKPLLLFFTGSDWSGWSMKMKQEILDSPAFCEKVGRHFLCVEIDFPHYKTLPPEVVLQNAHLKSTWKVEEYPRLILLNIEEREIARLGFFYEEGAKLGEDLLNIVEKDKKLSYSLKHLDSNAFSLEKLKELYFLAQELQHAKARDLILEKGIDQKKNTFFLLEKYRLLMEQGGEEEKAHLLKEQLMQADVENHIPYALAIIDFQQRAKKMNSQKDFKKLIKPLDEYLALYKEKKDTYAWKVEMMLAQCCLNFDKWNLALEYAESAQYAAPEEMKEEIAHFVDYIQMHGVNEEER